MAPMGVGVPEGEAWGLGPAEGGVVIPEGLPGLGPIVMYCE